MVHGGSSAIAVYNTDQKSIISKFKEADEFEKDALYLFFVDNVQGKTGDVAGFMPLQRQAGFIYDSPNLFVVAHELAHGAFNLRHTFSPEEFIAAERTTKNLMDYTGNTELWQSQWNLIHDPENVAFAWAQDEGEGEMQIPMIGETDYFDINGKYLGTRSKMLISEMRIADQTSWDMFKNTDNYPANYGTSIEEYKLNASLITAILNYYYGQYYNLNELKGGSIIAEYRDDPAETDYDNASNLLVIRVAYNYMGSKIASKFDVLNMFVHERGGHGTDWFKYKQLNEEDRNDWERTATLKMVQHETWGKTSTRWKKIIFSDYGQDDEIIYESERKIYFYPYGITSSEN